jgi:hypothetical protein
MLKKTTFSAIFIYIQIMQVYASEIISLNENRIAINTMRCQVQGALYCDSSAVADVYVVSNERILTQNLNGLQPEKEKYLPLAHKKNNSEAVKLSAQSLMITKDELGKNPKGLYAGLYFGNSSASFNYDGTPIVITEISYGAARPDSVVTVPNGVVATVTPEVRDLNLNLNAGLWLGYFPKFTTLSLGESTKIGLGAMSQLGFSFSGGGGLGVTLGIGPEMMFVAGPFSLNFGYGIGFAGQERKLGKLNIVGADYIVIQDNNTVVVNGILRDVPCTLEDFKSSSMFCRMCDNATDFVAKSGATTQSFYTRIGYGFGSEKESAINLVFGLRFSESTKLDYELWGAYKKGINSERLGLPGPEISSLGNSFDLSGVFFQIEFLTRPF